jgi:superkiller protein 3
MRLRILLFSLLLIFLANSGWTEESADEWFKKGNEASEAGDHEEAVRCFERTIALDPGHLGGFRNIGCVYGMRGMWDEAIEPFIKALAINPNDAQIHYNLGFCWYKRGMFDEAIAEFEKAVALNPEFRDAYHNLGIVYGKKEMFSQAIPMFRKAVEIGPDNAETHFSLGKAYKEVGDDMLAADHYYKAGILYLQKGHREGALAAYEKSQGGGLSSL